MGGHNKTDCRLQTVHSAQTVQTVQTVQFFCLLFLLNCDVHMIKVYTPFSYSFGNIGTVSNF